MGGDITEAEQQAPSNVIFPHRHLSSPSCVPVHFNLISLISSDRCSVFFRGKGDHFPFPPVLGQPFSPHGTAQIPPGCFQLEAPSPLPLLPLSASALAGSTPREEGRTSPTVTLMGQRGVGSLASLSSSASLLGSDRSEFSS